MAMPNGNLGLLNFGARGVLLPGLQPNSGPAHGFLISRPLNWALVRKGSVLDARSGSCRAVSALASGEAGASSSELWHIEKELTFSPTFTDYVKIMESVKVDRSKDLQGGDSDGQSSRRRFRGNGDASAVRGAGGRFGGPEEKTSERKKGYQRDRGSERGMRVNSAKNDRQKNVARLVKKRVPTDFENNCGRRGCFNENLQKRTVQGEMGEIGGDFEKNDHGQFEEYLHDGTVQGGVGESRGNFEKKDQGRVEEYVYKRMVRGEVGEIGSSIGKNDRGRFASHLKSKEGRGNGIQRQQVRNKHIQSNERGDSQGCETFTASGISAPLNHSSLSRSTWSVVRMEKEQFTSARHRTNEHKFNFARDRNISNSEVTDNRKFQRSQQRIESFGKKLAGDTGEENEIDCNIPILRRRYDHMQKMSVCDSNSTRVNTSGLKIGRHEVSQMHREKNVQTAKFVRRGDKNTDIGDRAAFKTFEVFTDVRNRPRVLQMEMEERIQKLASRLNATDVNTPEWQFSKMIHAAKIKFSDHSILRIIQILGQFGNWKCVLQVVEWLQSRDRFKSYKSRYIYTTVLDVLGKAKRPFEALNIFYTMKGQLSSYPDIAAYHCIAVTLGQAGLMKELFDVIDCMRSPPKKKFRLGPLQNWDPRLEPDLIVYNAVLNACVQQKQWEGAFWVLQQLKEKNIRPTNTTYGLVMEVMLACGKYNLVYDFFKKVETSSIPGALNYKVLVNALWREGKIDEAVAAVKDMERRGIVGSASLYYDLARCLCSGGRCKEALLQIKKICKVANKPLVVTYTGLIQTCIDNGSMENAKYVFEEMCNFCSPNNVTCNIMLKSYIQHGMFEDAKDLLANILNGKIRCKVDLSQRAVADKFTFNTFMEACAESEKWDDFEYAFREMLSNGYHFDERRHLRMVLDAFRGGKEQLLETTWEYLCYHQRVPPAPIIMERFCLKLREGNMTAAISCIKSFQESEIRNVSSMSWFNLLTRNADCLKEENIVKLVHELDNLVRSSSSSDSLYQNVLSSCMVFLSGATASEKAPTDKQMLLCDS